MKLKKRLGETGRPTVTVLIIDNNSPVRIRIGGREYQEASTEEKYRSNVLLKAGKVYRPAVTVLDVDKRSVPTLVRVGSKRYKLDDNHYIQ